MLRPRWCFAKPDELARQTPPIPALFERIAERPNERSVLLILSLWPILQFFGLIIN
jgi:hypothetical protein